MSDSDRRKRRKENKKKDKSDFWDNKASVLAGLFFLSTSLLNVILEIKNFNNVFFIVLYLIFGIVIFFVLGTTKFDKLFRNDNLPKVAIFLTVMGIFYYAIDIIKHVEHEETTWPVELLVWMAIMVAAIKILKYNPQKLKDQTCKQKEEAEKDKTCKKKSKTKSPREITCFWINAFDGFVNANHFINAEKKSNNHIFVRWLYLIFPIMLIFIEFCSTINSGVFNTVGKFSYLTDIGNSFALNILFILSYYLPAFYNKKVKKILDKDVIWRFESLVDENEEKKRATIIKLIIVIVSVLCISVFCGILPGRKMGYWLEKNSIIGRMVYFFIIFFTYYSALLLLGMVLSASIIIYYLLKYDYISYNDNLYNNNTGVKDCQDIIEYNFSYGVFYIIGSIAIVINDRLIIFDRLDMMNSFYYPENAISLITIELLLLGIAILPLIELHSYMNIKKENYINDLKSKILNDTLNSNTGLTLNELKDIINHGSVKNNFKNKLILFLSIITPIVGIIIQIIK